MNGGAIGVFFNGMLQKKEEKENKNNDANRLEK